MIPQDDPEQWAKPRVLISGAGVGGLTLALILEQAGYEYEVFERASKIKPLGAAMSFSHNVAPAMIQLGIYDEFLQISKTMESMEIFQEKSTKGEAQDVYDELQPQAAQEGTGGGVVPLTTVHFAQMTAMTGYPLRIFPRPKFFDLLLSRLPAHKIHLDKKIVNVTQDPREDGIDGITIHCADETTYNGDILVGADGAYSAVRRSIYKQAAAEDKLPTQDLDDLNLGYVTMVGTTEPLDQKMFPEVDDNACLHFRTVGENKPHTWSTFTVPDNRIAWSINTQVNSSQDPSVLRTKEWGDDSTDGMIDSVRLFPIPAGREGLGGMKTLGDLIDVTPRDNISKVFLEEKLFETWFYGRAVLIGDACHKLLPATGQGAVNAFEDAVILANCIYDLCSTSRTEIQSAFQQYRDQRYPHAAFQYQSSKSVAKVIQGQTWFESLWRRFTLTFFSKRFEQEQNSRGLDYMPQVAFLPQVPARGAVPLLPQPSSRALTFSDRKLDSMTFTMDTPTASRDNSKHDSNNNKGTVDNSHNNTNNNEVGSSSRNHQHAHKPSVESIEVVTSISNVNVLEDGSITPTPATVQQDPQLLKSASIDAIIDLSETIASTSLITAAAVEIPPTLLAPDQASVTAPSGSNTSSRATSPNLGAFDQQQQQQQQQQQRQRELHYESANAVLVPPLNFALVAPGVYRSGHPNKHNFPFMKKLGLKVIVQMSEEPYAPDLVGFLEQENIRRIHYKIEGNKEPFIEIDEEVIRSALVNILDARNHPLLIHCAKGKHRIGCLIGCLRKIQNWSMTSIFDEYRRFAGSKVLADQEFIEIFPAKVPYLLEYKPVWL
ncbi:hypothetical protein BGZ96_007278 [Linnemannia gamsii]|uniref:FAD/NAD(P)-binding domain-containing protein n=1 Tax=Linnemannia gamsii TaxID=64522 RepID=A0ABQ7KFT2_9FUNG|nr:hypothetical protein BGZ96_007278 [Linnemannia gamsii]